MNLQDVESGLEAALQAAAKLAPLAGTFGGPAGAAIGASITALAGAAAEIVPAIESDASILGTGDLTKIKALRASIEAENTNLIAQLNAS